MRKGQMVVLRELFAFSLGLAVMITTSSMFATIISPEISRMSVETQLSSALAHINSVITQTESLLINGFNTSLTVYAELPGMLGTTQFRAFTENGMICAKTFGQFVFKKCAENRLESNISGNYLSGSELKIDGFKNSTGTYISFSNKF